MPLTSVEIQNADGTKTFASLSIEGDVTGTSVSQGFRLVIREDDREPEIHDYQPE